MTGEFSLYWYSDQGDQFDELRFVEAERAVRRAKNLIDGPAAMLGMVQRVIITDGGDCCCFEWIKGSRYCFPKAGGREPTGMTEDQVLHAVRALLAPLPWRSRLIIVVSVSIFAAGWMTLVIRVLAEGIIR